MESGQVESIFIAAAGTELPDPVGEATAVPGRGLEGDRYFHANGTFSEKPGNGREITLIEAEALEGLTSDGIELSAAEARRNVVTRGVSLNDLVGRRFKVGEVECVGRRLCEPCDHLEKITRAGVLTGLVKRGGLRADILSAGTIAVGDEVRDLGGS